MVSTILEKIDNSSVLVADITLVDDGSLERRFPNPNVLIEVGYAIKSLGFSRILLIQNTFNGSIEDLPFDLRGKRIMTYNSHPDDISRSEQRNYLAKQISKALITILPVLEDVLPVEYSKQMLDIESTRQEIESLYRESPDDLSFRLENISNKIDSSSQIPPEIRSELLNRIVDLWKQNPIVSKEYLYALNQRSIIIHQTSGAFFNKGFLAGMMSKPYDSIAAYMKAVELNDPNPSLCYLNAGNRYREMNDLNIALAFFEKSVKLNKGQANAWLAGAQLSEQIGNPESTMRYYLGFLAWYNDLSDSIKNNPSYKQQAGQAQNYVNTH